MLKKIKTAFNLLSLDSYIRFCFYLLFFLTPLVMSSRTSEIFEFNKMMVIYVGSFIICLLSILRYLFSRDVRKHVYPLPLFGFLGAMFLSTSTSVDPHTSIFGYYGRFNGGLLSIIAYVLLSITALQIFDKKSITKLFKISLFTSAVVIAWGIPGRFGVDLSCILFTGQYTNACWTADFQPALRMFSTLGQPNWLGAYLVIHFFLGIFFIAPAFITLFKKETLDSSNKKVLVLMSLYLLFNIMGIWFTQSRSTLLALVLALGIIGLIMISKYKQRFTKAIFIGLIASIVIGMGSLIVFPKQLLSSNVVPKEGFFVTDSSDIRKIVWQGSVALGLKYPLLGTGPETFAYTYFFTRPLEHNYVSEWDFIYNKAHNEFLHYFATTGFIGLITYLSVIVTVILLISRLQEKLAYDQPRFWFYLAILGAYLSVLITNFFGFSTSTIQLWFYLLPIFAICYTAKQSEEVLLQTTQLSKKTKMLYSILICISIIGLYMLQRTYEADRLYAAAKVALAQEDYQDASLKLVHALARKYEHVYEDKLSSTTAQLAFLSSFDDPQSTAQFISMSQQHNLSTLRQSPYNQQYYRTQAKNYYLYYQATRNLDDLIQAVEATEQAIKIAPTDAQNYHTLALFYIVLSQETTVKADQVMYQEKSGEAVRKALRLKPYYPEATELLNSL